ncbi:MAG: type II secretion system protein N [Betaproteobacteria bacterium]
MRAGLIFLVGVLLLVTALVARAPATLLDARLDAATRGRLRLVDAAGTLWDGTGELRLTPGESALPVAWRVDAWPLLTGELRGTIALAGAAPAAFMVDRRDAEVRDLGVELPAQAVLRALDAPMIVAGGQVALRTPRLAWRAERIDGELGVRWSAASVSLAGLPMAQSPALALGDVRFDATGQADALSGPLSNVGGEVELSGSASTSVGGKARVDVSLTPRAGLDAERASALKSMLSAVAQPDAAGAFRIVWPR